jgi:putative ABC transport system substrate-binding protein
MNRRGLLLAALGLAATGVRAQPRLPRIGYLLLPSLSDVPSRERQAFLNGLRESGYVPGKTVEIIYGSAENEVDFLQAVCEDLVRSQVDVIVTSGADAVTAAYRTTRAVPIVMLAVGDPVAMGVVHSLSRPGRNVTGVSFLSSALVGKRIQLARDVIPTAKRIAVLWNSQNPSAQLEAGVAIDVARRLGLDAEGLPADSGRALIARLKSLEAHKPHVLYVIFEGALLVAHRSVIAEFGLRQRIPVISGWSAITEAGGLFSYAPDLLVIYHRAAYYVDRILKGMKPSELPVELPTKIELVLNLKTAKSLGLTIPQGELLSADRVIE